MNDLASPRFCAVVSCADKIVQNDLPAAMLQVPILFGESWEGFKVSCFLSSF